MSDTTIPTPRQYEDALGNPQPLHLLVRNYPEWAEIQIRHRDTLSYRLATITTERDALREAGSALVNCFNVEGHSDNNYNETCEVCRALAAWFKLTK